MSIDDLLERSANAKPRRNLSAQFTKNTISHIKASPRPKRSARLKEICMKLLDKPALALATIVAAVAVSGTGYAAVGGVAGISALFGGQQNLPTGNRIVQVDTTNCKDVITQFTVTVAKDKRNPSRYFEINKDSKLTNEQVVQMVKGECELSVTSSSYMEMLKTLEQNPANKNRLVGNAADSIVTAISPTSISLDSSTPVFPGGINDRTKQVFNHIDPQVVVYDDTRKLTLGDIKVGDHVSISYRATGDALRNSETTRISDVKTDEQTVVSIVKVSPNFSAMLDYQRNFGKEFHEVTPCDTNKSPSGYCTLEQLNKK